MTGWCPICRASFDPLWTDTPVPAAYHLFGEARHAVAAPGRPLVRETVVRQRGEYVTVLPGTATALDLLTDPTEDE